ncbi:hypothetical protein [Helicobacter sp.]|nr:hypothetical protein [Helicobacter sp.]
MARFLDFNKIYFLSSASPYDIVRWFYVVVNASSFCIHNPYDF